MNADKKRNFGKLAMTVSYFIIGAWAYALLTAPKEFHNITIVGDPFMVPPFWLAWTFAFAAVMALCLSLIVVGNKKPIAHRLPVFCAALLGLCYRWPQIEVYPDDPFWALLANTLLRLILGVLFWSPALFVFSTLPLPREHPLWRTRSGRALLPMTAIVLIGWFLLPPLSSFSPQ